MPARLLPARLLRIDTGRRITTPNSGGVRVKVFRQVLVDRNRYSPKASVPGGARRRALWAAKFPDAVTLWRRLFAGLSILPVSPPPGAVLISGNPL